jgi:alpha-D-ribose 1-methylphosphonate 5-triphosphate diphosphatase
MLLNNLQIILPDAIIERGALRIEGERIAEIYETPVSADHAAPIDATGLTAIPGVIDIHGDMLEREIEPRPGCFLSGGRCRLRDR